MGALLEAQHLVKEPQGLRVWPVVLLGGGTGAHFGAGPHGREGETRVAEKSQSSPWGPRQLSMVPWVEASPRSSLPHGPARPEERTPKG